MLSFYPSRAAPATGGQPVADPAEQRIEGLTEPNEIEEPLKKLTAKFRIDQTNAVVVGERQVRTKVIDINHGSTVGCQDLCSYKKGLP